MFNDDYYVHLRDIMSIIAVSDVHLGFKIDGVSHSNKAEFDLFLKDVVDKLNKNDFFVMCGDILDMWRRDMAGVMIENADTLQKLREIKAKIYYIAGNHDYHLNCLQNMLPFEFAKQKSLDYDGRTYLFKHGYDFDPLVGLFEKNGFDWLCHQHEDLKERLSKMYETLGMDMEKKMIKSTKRKLSRRYIEEFNLGEIEKAEFTSTRMLKTLDSQTMAKRFMMISDLGDLLKPVEARLSEEEIKATCRKAQKEIGQIKNGILVYGHTHRPFISKNVVNLGSWVKEQNINNTYLEIRDGSMKLIRFKTGEVSSGNC
jgi:UDP-2,3-diacylglucosamine pyrophosphatase LpxH